MAGIKALRRVMLGREVTAGVPRDVTTLWRGEGLLTDVREIVEAEESVGVLLGERMYVPRLGAEIELDETPATFEQLPFVLAASIESNTDGVRDGSGSGFIYQYDLSFSTENTIQTYTIEVGDNERVDRAEYCYVRKFTLSGAKREPVLVQAAWRGRQATDAEFTAGVSLPVVEEVLFGKGRLYIDDSGGTIGTTQKTSTWLGFSLNWPSGWKEVYTGDGNLYFTTLQYVGHKEDKITGEITLEHDSAAEAEIEAARNEEVRLIRMEFRGSALTTAGSSYTYKTLRIDLAARYTEIPELDEEDGDDVVTLPFEVVYSSADNLAAQITVVNELAGLLGWYLSADGNNLVVASTGSGLIVA